MTSKRFQSGVAMTQLLMISVRDPRTMTQSTFLKSPPTTIVLKPKGRFEPVSTLRQRSMTLKANLFIIVISSMQFWLLRKPLEWIIQRCNCWSIAGREWFCQNHLDQWPKSNAVGCWDRVPKPWFCRNLPVVLHLRQRKSFEWELLVVNLSIHLEALLLEAMTN